MFDINKTKDPVASFLQIVMGDNSSLVVDGRRFYTMVSFFNEDTKQTTVELSNYFNLWADHKRNKFEKIIFEKKLEEIMPYKIFIHFDGRVFKLEQN